MGPLMPILTYHSVEMPAPFLAKKHKPKEINSEFCLIKPNLDRFHFRLARSGTRFGDKSIGTV